MPITMLPRTNTTDGFQTIENQTQKFPGFYEKADEFIARQIDMVGNEIEDIFDIRPACCIRQLLASIGSCRRSLEPMWWLLAPQQA